MGDPASGSPGSSRDRRSALILAGGASRRIGEPKPFLEIGGRPLLERLLAATESLGDVVLAVDDPARFVAALGRVGWEPAPGAAPAEFRRGARKALIVADPEPGQGPLAGLASGLAAIETGYCWVVSCDLPFVTGELGTWLLDRLELAMHRRGVAGSEARAVDAVIPRIDGRWQPLCAAYRRSAGRAAADLVERGIRSVHALLDAIAVEAVSRRELESVGDPDRLLFNLNTRKDLERARRLAEDPPAAANGPPAP